MRWTVRSLPPWKALTIWGTRAALSTPAASTANMTLGSLLATEYESAATDPVSPTAAASRNIRTRPSTLETSVPAAMTAAWRPTRATDASLASAPPNPTASVGSTGTVAPGSSVVMVPL